MTRYVLADSLGGGIFDGEIAELRAEDGSQLVALTVDCRPVWVSVSLVIPVPDEPGENGVVLDRHQMAWQRSDDGRWYGTGTTTGYAWQEMVEERSPLTVMVCKRDALPKIPVDLVRRLVDDLHHAACWWHEEAHAGQRSACDNPMCVRFRDLEAEAWTALPKAVE